MQHRLTSLHAMTGHRLAFSKRFRAAVLSLSGLCVQCAGAVTSTLSACLVQLCKALMPS